MTVDNVAEQITRLKNAAELPMKNYQRILNILGKIESMNKMVSLPQNAAVKPHIAAIVRKVAGVFAEVDTVDDLDKPLAQIEKAISSMYKDSSKNTSFYFERKGLKNHPVSDNYDRK